MRTPQPGIFAQGTRAHYYLELELRPDAPDDDVAAALAALREPAVTSGGSNTVLGFGPALWRRLRPDDAPASLRDFEPIGPVPATQADVWLWIHGTNHDVVLDVARSAVVALAPVTALAYHQPGFVYLDSRDMTGFIDGTENPPIWEAPEVVAVPDGEPGAGGAHVLVMRWEHNLGAFHALSEDDQERVIGRTKGDSVELDDDVKPADAHIARVVIEEDGEELEVYRRSTPFGTVEEQGLQFVAFTADPEIPRKMLHRMIGDGDGIVDHLTRFSRPVRSAFYFVPSVQALREVFGSA